MWRGKNQNNHVKVEAKLPHSRTVHKLFPPDFELCILAGGASPIQTYVAKKFLRATYVCLALYIRRMLNGGQVIKPVLAEKLLLHRHLYSCNPPHLNFLRTPPSAQYNLGPYFPGTHKQVSLLSSIFRVRTLSSQVHDTSATTAAATVM